MQNMEMLIFDVHTEDKFHFYIMQNIEIWKIEIRNEHSFIFYMVHNIDALLFANFQH